MALHRGQGRILVGLPKQEWRNLPLMAQNKDKEFSRAWRETVDPLFNLSGGSASRSALEPTVGTFKGSVSD